MREGALEHRNRGLHVGNACLGAPGAITLDVTPGPDSDREILMPNDLPIRGRSLVEQEGSNREAIGTKGSGGGSPNGLVQRQHANLRDAFEEHTRATTPRLRDRVVGLLERREKTRNLRTLERL